MAFVPTTAKRRTNNAGIRLSQEKKNTETLPYKAWLNRNKTSKASGMPKHREIRLRKAPKLKKSENKDEFLIPHKFKLAAACRR